MACVYFAAPVSPVRAPMLVLDGDGEDELTAMYEGFDCDERAMFDGYVDGVLPGRIYRVRLVQLVEHREVLLAQGDVRLD